MPFVPSLPEVREQRNADAVAAQLRAAAEYAMDIAAERAGNYSDSDAADIRSATEFIGQFDTIEQVLRRAEDDQRASESGPVTNQVQSFERARTPGELVTESDGYRSRQGKGYWDSGSVSVDVGSLLSPEARGGVRVLVDSTTDGSATNAGIFLPTTTRAFPQTPQRRRFWLRDALNVQSTGLTSIPYAREVDPTSYELGASATAPGAQKAEVNFKVDPDDAVVRKITAWLSATTEMLDDVPTLQGQLNNRLAYYLAIREEQQILNGPASAAPQLKGILNFTGVQTQSSINDDLPGTVGRAISKVEAVDGFPNAIAINPVTFWLGVTERQSTHFDAGYTSGAPSSVPELLWGLPAVRTRGVAQGKFVLGDFALGATLFDRQQTTIRVGNQHSTYFTENKVAIVAEERIALAVHRPDFFVDGTITFT